MDCIVDAVRSASVVLRLTFFKLHAFNLDECDFIAILEIKFLVSENFDHSLLFTCNRLYDDCLKLFTILVKYFKVLTEIIEDSSVHASQLSEDKLLALGPAIVINCNGCGVVSFCQNDDVHRLEVPRLSLHGGLI